jgi:hypothetical protein
MTRHDQDTDTFGLLEELCRERFGDPKQTSRERVRTPAQRLRPAPAVPQPTRQAQTRRVGR